MTVERGNTRGANVCEFPALEVFAAEAFLPAAAAGPAAAIVAALLAVAVAGAVALPREQLLFGVSPAQRHTIVVELYLIPRPRNPVGVHAHRPVDPPGAVVGAGLTDVRSTPHTHTAGIPDIAFPATPPAAVMAALAASTVRHTGHAHAVAPVARLPRRASAAAPIAAVMAALPAAAVGRALHARAEHADLDPLAHPAGHSANGIWPALHALTVRSALLPVKRAGRAFVRHTILCRKGFAHPERSQRKSRHEVSCDVPPLH